METQTKDVVKAHIYAETLYYIAHAVSPISDVAELKVTEKGFICVRELNENHTILVEINDNTDCDNVKAKITIDTNALKRIISKHYRFMHRFPYLTIDGNNAILEYTNKKTHDTEIIKLPITYKERKEPPTLKLNGMIEVETDRFAEVIIRIIDLMNTIANRVIFKYDGKILTITNKDSLYHGYRITADIETRGDPVTEPITAMYDAKDLKLITPDVLKYFSVDIAFNTNKPLMLRYHYYPMEIKYYLAPIINS